MSRAMPAYDPHPPLPRPAYSSFSPHCTALASSDQPLPPQAEDPLLPPHWIMLGASPRVSMAHANHELRAASCSLFDSGANGSGRWALGIDTSPQQGLHQFYLQLFKASKEGTRMCRYHLTGNPSQNE